MVNLADWLVERLLDSFLFSSYITCSGRSRHLKFFLSTCIFRASCDMQMMHDDDVDDGVQKTHSSKKPIECGLQLKDDPTNCKSSYDAQVTVSSDNT